jgi:hypothetical protein
VNCNEDIAMMIGQLRQLAQVHTLDALAAAEPQARIAFLRLACDAARKEEAIARWRGDSGFMKFVPPLHDVAEGQFSSEFRTVRSPQEKRNDDNTRNSRQSPQRLCA